MKGALLGLAIAAAFNPSMADEENTHNINIQHKNRKAYARYLTRLREVEIREEKQERSNRTSRSGRRKKR